MKRLAIIPAKGNSVRIPRKNIKDFRGKPMMQWPIEAAQESHLFDQIIVSTDDAEIVVLAQKLGCLVHLRPPDDGTAGTQEIAATVLRSIDSSPRDEVCVIYPCSPMLTAADLRDSCNALTSPNRFVVSYLGNQDAGCFYWGWAGAFAWRLPLDSDHMLLIQVDPNRFIDINTTEDWTKAESMFDQLRSNKQ